LEVKERKSLSDGRDGWPPYRNVFNSYQKIDVTKLMSHLSYKAERAGRRVVKLDPRNTSKTFMRGRDCP